MPSILRDFSAPVVLEVDYTDEELAFLAAKDSNPFNRWEADQRLATRRVLAMVASLEAGNAIDEAHNADNRVLIDSFRATLNETSLDPAFRELALTLPSEIVIAEQMDVIDPQAVHAVRQLLRRSLAAALRADWMAVYQDNGTSGACSPDPESAVKRALKNLALSYLAELGDADCHRIDAGGEAGNCQQQERV